LILNAIPRIRSVTGKSVRRRGNPERGGGARGTGHPKTGAGSVISINRSAALKKMSNARGPATAPETFDRAGKMVYRCAIIGGRFIEPEGAVNITTGLTG